MEIKLNNILSEKIDCEFDISLTNNKINFIIGKNGCGKTTLLKIIAGLETEYSGEIFVNNKANEPITLKHKTMFIGDEITDFISCIKVYDELISTTFKIKKEEIYEYLKNFYLDVDILDKNMYDISYNQKKIVLLISSLISNKKILLLDNPTVGLNEKQKQSLIRILKKKKKENIIILIASNDMEFVLELADIVMLITKNKLEINTKNILYNENLLKQNNLEIPKIIKLLEYAKKTKYGIKLKNVDNINDFIKEVYRNA